MPLSPDLDASLGPAPQAYTQPEVVVLRLRRHGRRLVLPVIVLLATAAAAGFWVGTLPEAWMNLVAGGGALLVAIVLGVGPVVAWLSRRATVTSRRVILRDGVLTRHRSEVAFSRVREVRSRRSLAQRLFGSGSVDLMVGAESVTIDDVPGIGLVVDALQELVERNYEHSTQAFGMPGAPALQYGTGALGQLGQPGQMPGTAPGAGIPHQPTTRLGDAMSPQADPSRPISFW